MRIWGQTPTRYGAHIFFPVTELCADDTKCLHHQIIEPKEGLLQKTPIYEIKLIFGFALTIICLALSLSAYTKLQEISSDVYDITENWETQPVISVYVPMSVDEPCPDGYSVISLEKSDFPGITKGSCGCTPNVEGYVSTAANCSDSAEPTNYCMSMPPQGEVRSSKWRNSNICYQRGGESAASWATGYIRRPYPDGEGRCPDGYRKCGVGASYEDGAICFPVDSQCPITGMLVTPHDEPPPLSGHWHPAGELDGNFTLFVRRQFPGEMPIVDLELHLTEYTSNDYLDGVSYDADNNKRGPCYTGRKQVFSDSDVVSDQEILWAYSVNYPTSCRKEDKRFTLFDRRDSQSHFLETIGRESEYCEGLQLYALSDPRYNVSSDPDYVNSRIPCGTDGFVCGRDSYQYTDCADEICDVVVNQNICGLYTRAARSLADSTQTFGMYRRGEIIWRETCVVTQDQIYRNVDPLEAAVKAQLAGVVLSFVFGIVFGIVIPVVGLVVSENTTGKFRVHSQFELLLIQVDPYVHMCKLGPIVAAIIFISQVHTLVLIVCGRYIAIASIVPSELHSSRLKNWLILAYDYVANGFLFVFE